MARRTKEEIEKMEEIVSNYLSESKGPHDAWNNFIKDHLMQGKQMPSYVTGVKDFVKLYEKGEPKVL